MCIEWEHFDQNKFIELNKCVCVQRRVFTDFVMKRNKNKSQIACMTRVTNCSYSTFPRSFRLSGSYFYQMDFITFELIDFMRKETHTQTLTTNSD